MPENDGLAEWAALFLRSVEQADAVEVEGVKDGGEAGDVITRAARELLKSIDAGGVPAFVTSHLRQIALDNGIDVASNCTPNDIVDAIRRKAGGAAGPAEDGHGA